MDEEEKREQETEEHVDNADEARIIILSQRTKKGKTEFQVGSHDATDEENTTWMLLKTLKQKYPQALEAWYEKQSKSKTKKRKSAPTQSDEAPAKRKKTAASALTTTQSDEAPAKRKKTAASAPTTAKKGKKQAQKLLMSDDVKSVVGIKMKTDEAPVLWSVELQDGTHAELSGNELAKLCPDLFVAFIEDKIRTQLQ